MDSSEVVIVDQTFGVVQSDEIADGVDAVEMTVEEDKDEGENNDQLPIDADYFGISAAIPEINTDIVEDLMKNDDCAAVLEVRQ